jgi:hypothetical protein
MRSLPFGLGVLLFWTGCSSSSGDGGAREIARIEETKSTNTPAIEVIVYDDASAERNWGTPPNIVDRRLSPAGSPDVLQFLADLAVVGDVSAIPTERCTKSASFGTSTTVRALGRTSGDVQCLSNSATVADRSLQTDIDALER